MRVDVFGYARIVASEYVKTQYGAHDEKLKEAIEEKFPHLPSPEFFEVLHVAREFVKFYTYQKFLEGNDVHK